MDNTITVRVVESNTPITVSIPGMQGPPGGGSAGNISGLISTGAADGRYYPRNTNPSGYLTAASAGGVQFINGISGNVNLTGLGTITVFINGQNIQISGASGIIAGNTNLSGYITTGSCDARYLSINSGGLYYLTSNPSGYITGFNSGLYVLKTETGNYTGIFVTRQETGQFYPASNPQQYIRSGDAQNISGALSSRIGDTGLYLFGLINASSAGVSSVNSASGALTINGAGNISVTTAGQNIVISGNTGYLINYATVNNLGATGSNLQSQINLISLTTGIFVQSGSLYNTGSINSNFQEIWIAPRIDNISGNGTSYNPYDGSTASKLQRLLVGFNQHSGTINFLPGQYYLTPANQVSFVWSVGNWKIKGAGIDKTIITATGYGASGAGHYCLFSSNDSPINSFEIEDITLDGGTRTSGVSVVLLQMFQPNSIARRVKVKNFGTTVNGYESFPIIFSPYFSNTSSQTNCLIEDCIATNPWTGNAVGISAFVISPTLTSEPLDEIRNTNSSCIIRNCYVDFGSGNLRSGEGYSHAFTAPVVENNYCRNVGVGAYYDTYSEKNILIRNNTFLDCKLGVQLNFNGSSYKKDVVLVENNFIELPSKTYSNIETYQGILLYGTAGGPPYTFNNVQVSNNRVGTTSGVFSPNNFYVGISTHGTHNLIIKDNIISDFNRAPAGGFLIQDPSSYKNIQLWNNFTTGLGSLTNINCPYLTTGASGSFYSIANLNGFANSGNLGATGSLLDGRITLISGFATGASGYLQSQINNSYLKSNPDSYAQSGNFISGVTITGGATIRGSLNINAGANITLTQQGPNAFSIASSAGGGLGTAVTGIYTTGVSNTVTGAVRIIGTGNVTITQNGNTVIVSGNSFISGSLLPFVFGNTNLVSGLDNSQFIQFPQNFAAVPIVIGTIYNNSGDPIIGCQTSGIARSGFYLNFSDSVTSSGYYFQYLATTGLGYYDLATSLLGQGGGGGGTVSSNTIAGITGISITGGSSITGILNIQAGANITLVQGGSNTLTVTSAAGTAQLFVGSGIPEGVVSATSGSIYSDWFNQYSYNKFTGSAAYGWA